MKSIPTTRFWTITSLKRKTAEVARVLNGLREQLVPMVTSIATQHPASAHGNSQAGFSRGNAKNLCPTSRRVDRL